MKYLLFVALLFSTSTMANTYEFNPDKSQVTFTATHAGNEFQGEFSEWSADINFDENDLGQSSVMVIFNTASAKTGNAMYDGTLPTADWFDVKNHPQATFQSTSFEKTDGQYKVTGDLTIKDVTKEIAFDFTLKGDTPIHMHAAFPINRLDFNIGKSSDGDAEWVSQDIQINLHIETRVKK
jgi:polyisoprenoid-binding protein YceI